MAWHMNSKMLLLYSSISGKSRPSALLPNMESLLTDKVKCQQGCTQARSYLWRQNRGHMGLGVSVLGFRGLTFTVDMALVTCASPLL